MTWYTGDALYDTLLLIGFGYALLVFAASFVGTAAYGGRFGSKGRRGGVKLGSRAGWIIMELPGLLVFPVIFFMGPNAYEAVPPFFLAVWMFHYSNRALVTPMLMRVQPGSAASFSLGVIIAGWITLFLHGYFNAAYLTEFGDQYTRDWFQDPRFQIGLVIYLFGFGLNLHSDRILRNLRPKQPDPDAPRYRIPYGGGFRWVTCPQYLGEILSFTGFAVMTWNLGAVFVLAMTVGNLVPRALYTHRWFHKNFDDYPPERRAIFPGLL